MMRVTGPESCEFDNPSLPLVELEPYARVNRESTKIRKQYLKRDYSGRSIYQPDSNNPTRWKYERPLETIRAWNNVIDGKKPDQNMHAARMSNLKPSPSLKDRYPAITKQQDPLTSAKQHCSVKSISRPLSPILSVASIDNHDCCQKTPEQVEKKQEGKHAPASSSISSDMLCAAASNGYFRKPAVLNQSLVPLNSVAPPPHKHELKHKLKQFVQNVLN
ncbi:fungal protein [Schizosaccharomyces cryophilus OY26]|uniref:Fungal protein n=1 Tax=Schizosaccharomyces cryophilus (strain OY26 / ATCC MYA-4695 / CBS 11777 / NBRC 106824 / NRRL Y48691) TaxID=653667 RepID=S9WZE7_SCHCR|nr:uncharacterized protein SPOG_03566 [Schizosaccharomyces cryophilus OY26]EPY50097.1 fungal protein [Schizosaccharomyces cryophilus OY26]